ncbi:hypothetical protein ES703_93004 [subsurface metagenome]
MSIIKYELKTPNIHSKLKGIKQGVILKIYEVTPLQLPHHLIAIKAYCTKQSIS